MGTKIATQILYSQNTPPEAKLWQAVVLTAFEDATCNLSDKKSSIAKWEAFKWFHEKEDFEKVCYLAEFEPEYVLERFDKAIDNEVIIFNPKQIAWAKYNEILNAYNNEVNKKKRKLLRIELEQKRQRLMNASTVPQV